MSPWLSDLFLSSQSDERLVALACAGHDRAFAAIVERYRGELHAHARRLSSDGRAEDIVQQTFLSAFSALRSGTEVSHLRGWLYQIVRNAAARIHGPRDASLDQVSLTGDPLEDVVQERVLALSALSEVGRLPDRQRQALVGTVQGHRRAEIARSMGLSEGAVRQLVHRARMSVRAAVTAVTPYPLLRWLTGRSGGSAEVVLATGAASAGGATLKLGALLASGVIAGGIVVGVDRKPHAHPNAGGAAATRAQASGRRGTRTVLGGSAARPSAGALGGSFLGTLPAVLGRGGAAGTRSHESATSVGRGDRPGSSSAEGHGETTTNGGGQGPGGVSQGGPGAESSSGSGPGPSGDGGSGEGSSGSSKGTSGSGKSSTGSGDGGGRGRDGGSGAGSESSGSGSGPAGSSGEGGSGGSGSSQGGGDGGSGDGGGTSTKQASGSGSSAPSTSVTTSSESGPGGGGTTSGDPASATTPSNGGGKGPDGDSGASGGGHGSNSGRD